MGLPEVQLGLLRWQLEPKITEKVGIQQAMQMILTGKQLRAKQAVKLGLADAVISEDYLLPVAERFVPKANLVSASLSALLNQFLEGTTVGRRVLFSQA